MSFGPYDETEDDSDDTDEIDPFTEELIDHMTAPVDDRTSAASLVPLILRGAAEYGEAIKNIQVTRDLDDMYMELRQEAIGRLATGMDIPPEIMEGKGGLNHWTGYNIDADFISKHVSPIGDMLSEFLTSAYLRPMLVEFEGMSEEEASQYRLAFDASAITSRTDTGPNARAAFDRHELSRMAYLRENGFDEADAPTTEERQERDLRALMQAEPIIYGPQIMGMLYPDLEGVIDICEAECGPDDESLLPEAGQDRENPSNAPARKRDTGPSARPIIDDETGQGEPSPRGPAGPRESESIIDRLATGADAALERALEVAGSRILSKMSGAHVSMKDRFRSTPKSQIVSALTPQEFAQLGVAESDLFSGAWESLGVRGKGWLRKHFIEQGCDTFVADEKSAMVINALIPLMEVHATAAMSKSLRVGPNGLRVPDELIERAFEQHNRIPT